MGTSGIMNQALDFGLLTALLYGISDFIAKFSSRAVGVWRTLFWGQSSSALLLTLWVVFGGGAPTGVFSQPLQVWAVAILANVTILAATSIFYRALTIGSFGVVMPIVATYGAIAALLSAMLGEPIGFAALGGIAIAVLGGAMASVPGRGAGALEGSGKGAIMAAVAAALYGIGFFAQARYAVPKLGPLVPVWLYYGLGSILLGGVALVMRRDLSPPRFGQMPVVFGSGLAASSAFVVLALAVTGGNVAVPTVLASLASVVTVVLARVLVKEQVAIHQWIGIIAVVFGLAMLHGGGHAARRGSGTASIPVAAVPATQGAGPAPG